MEERNLSLFFFFCLFATYKTIYNFKCISSSVQEVLILLQPCVYVWLHSGLVFVPVLPFAG